LHIGYGYVLEDPVFNSGQVQNILIFSERPEGVGSKPDSYATDTDSAFLGGKSGWHEVTHQIYCQA